MSDNRGTSLDTMAMNYDVAHQVSDERKEEIKKQRYREGELIDLD